MYLLDTMIPSELRKGGRANPGVAKWSRSIADNLQFISVASIFEMRRGALQVERKDPQQAGALHRWLDRMIVIEFAGRILPINERVAQAAAALHIPTEREAIDMFIAATALEYGFTLVTRNERHFESTGVKLLNPFT